MTYIDLLGKPFVWGGRGPEGFDCYGLCIEMAKRNGQVIPDSAWSEDPALIAALVEETEEKGFVRVDAPQAGDFVGFMLRPPFVSHIGYMLNQHEFLHITKGTKVSRERIDSLLWQRKVAGFYRWTK
jgi:cell wall-associated NlpC family hydrolase